MLKKTLDFLKEWYQGNVNLDERMMNREKDIQKNGAGKAVVKRHRLRTVRTVEKTEREISAVSYKIFSVVFCLVLCSVLVMTVSFLPVFADENAPTVNEVYEHYVGQGRDETGAVNTVAGMILDYRAFDTLGESFVLFSATCAVLLLLERTEKKWKYVKRKQELFLYKNDPIAMFTLQLLFPVIMIFGVYILFNGHLSPGGGFSGGAILGAGFILYAMIYGEEKAAKLLSPRTIRIVTLCALSFYCLAKSYSFFTGNEFNGIHSVITPGTPGDFLSGGLILPLNIAVGLVVCCTMYSFYMLFRRGNLE